MSSWTDGKRWSLKPLFPNRNRMVDTPWAEALGVPESLFKEWESGPSSHSNFLHWCLENKKISGAAYLAWAQKHFELPLISSEFFRESAPPQQIWKELAAIPWGRYFLPLAQWQDCLYVGVLQPLQTTEIQKHVEEQTNRKLVYLLAHPDDLKNWDQVRLQSAGASAESEPEPAPAAEAPLVPDGLSLEGLSPEGLAPAEGLAAEPESIPASTPEVPEGLAAVEQTHAGPMGMADLPVMPEGLNLSGLSLSLPKEENTHTQTQVEAAPLPPPPQPPPTMSAPTPPPPPTPTPLRSAPPPPPPKAANFPLSQNENLGDLPFPVQQLFQSYQNYFAQKVILRFQEGRLVVWKWDGSIRPDGNTVVEVDLVKPSVFRIVADSKTPYHGYVVPNPVNSEFFKTWAKGVLPEHLSIAPILNPQGSLVGMVAGWGIKEQGERLDPDRFTHDAGAIAEILAA